MNGGPHVIVLDVQRLRADALAAALRARGISAATSPDADAPTLVLVHGDAAHLLARSTATTAYRSSCSPAATVTTPAPSGGHPSSSAPPPGSTVIERAVTDALAGRSPATSAASAVPDSPAAHARQAVRRLSGREQAVLERVAMGRRNDEIGAELGISPNTVRTHVQNIFGKLDGQQPARGGGHRPARRPDARAECRRMSRACCW